MRRKCQEILCEIDPISVKKEICLLYRKKKKRKKLSYKLDNSGHPRAGVLRLFTLDIYTNIIILL